MFHGENTFGNDAIENPRRHFPNFSSVNVLSCLKNCVNQLLASILVSLGTSYFCEIVISLKRVAL